MFPRLVIPSYKRSHMITHKTLKYLKSVNYPADKIYIFVVAEEEHLYKERVPSDMYGQIIVGLPGLKEQRNFIIDFLDEDEIYISMDDDITTIKMDNWPFLDMIKDAVSKIETKEYGLASCLSNDDARRFRGEPTSHLAHIIGAFWIARNHKELKLQGMSEKEDYERTLMYFIKYKKILRYRSAGVDTKYVNNDGGIAIDGRRDREELAITFITKIYYKYCKRVTKKNGWPDIHLNWRATV